MIAPAPTSSAAGLLAAIEVDGFAFLKRWSERTAFAELLQAHGRPWNDGRIDRIAPNESDAPNTYSGLYGLGEFPLHTDLAHWPEPPRYVVLCCVKGHDKVVTPIVDGRDLIDRAGEHELRTALVKPRRPLRGRIPLLDLFRAPRKGLAMRLRWDQRYIIPASAAGAAGMMLVQTILATMPTREITLSEPGDTLWLDNWRMLHGRSAVPTAGANRIIERAYLGELF